MSQRNNNKALQLARRNRNRKVRKMPMSYVLPVITPVAHRCLLKYNSHISGFSNTGVQYTDIQFYANGLYDPSASGTDSSQPDGFTSLATLYNNYIVNSCQLDVLISNREAFAINLNIGFYPGAKVIGSPAEADDIGESPFGKTKLLSAKGGMDCVRLRNRIQLHELWNRRYYYGDNNFQATTASNPTTLGVAVISTIAPSGSTLENGVSCNIRLTYDVTFTGRKGTDQVSLSDSIVNTARIETFKGRNILEECVWSRGPLPP